MNITMNELFKSKKIWLQNVITPKKRAFRKLGVRKLGVLGIIFLLCTTTFISGYNINSYAASSSTVLPISRGGTGADEFASGQALIGNGSNSLTTKAIDVAPTNNSANLITSGALKTVSDVANIGQAQNNLYLQLEGFTDLDDLIYILGYTPDDNSRHGVSFAGNFLLARDTVGITATNISDIRLYIAMSHSLNYEGPNFISINVWAKLGHQPIRFFEIGKFTYNEKKYYGIRINKTYNGYEFLNGYFNYAKAGIKRVCETSEDICVGKKIAYSDVQDYVGIKNMDSV
ncbi:MAG: hypothetical protein LBT91_01920 [Bifidobacteriaceae bacterium]|jgi:hypothetical protein|nr:hypothetical protein [Bifidobacteriaceae bacterium]